MLVKIVFGVRKSIRIIVKILKYGCSAEKMKHTLNIGFVSVVSSLPLSLHYELGNVTMKLIYPVYDFTLFIYKLTLLSGSAN